MSCTTYNKRPGTSGIRGQLYETKLISITYFRAIRDGSIEEFHLATNIDKIGTFDDICFKAKVKGFDRPLAVFIQAKHRENDKRQLTIDLAEYFKSYLKIRQTFAPNSEDVLFKGKFDETECLFVIYTTTNDEFENDLFENSFASKLNDLIDTGGTAKQPYKNEQDIEFLCKEAMKEEIISLAGRMAMFICGEGDFRMMMSDEFVLRYHVILAQKVIDVSEIQPGGHRNASFQQEFFNTNEELLILLKKTLYMAIVKKQKLSDTDIQKFLTAFLEEPTDFKILSKLIGTVIQHKNGQLEFVNNTMSTVEDFKRRLNEVYVSQSTVNKAVELTTKEILSSLEFKVPTAFGNKDLTIRGNNKKVERRLDHLTSKFCELIDKSAPNNIVTIQDSLEIGLFNTNGGIAGAVGNILVLDESTKLMKFTDNCELLGDLAKQLLQKLKSRIHNLHEYRFSLKTKKFPLLSLDGSEFAESLARDFFKKLIFYTKQADEEGVEEILRSEIEVNECNNVNNFRIRTDAIVSIFHENILNWRKIPKKATYLTKESKMFENAIHNIFKDPLMNVINQMYKIAHNNYTFNEDALKDLKLQDQHLRTVITTENSALTVAKVIQCLEKQNHVVLDLEYILNLPPYDLNLLRTELANTNNEKILIFVCDKVRNFKYVYLTLGNLAKAVHNNKTIVITNQMSVGILNKYFLQAENIVYDEKHNLTDMSKDSQERILMTARVIFQGQEVSLDLLVDDDSLACMEGVLLNRIISKDPIEIGKPIGNSNYDEMEHLYVDRRVKETENHIDIVIETLYDIVDDVVLLTAKPGMGKSTLLTHLSLKTKELDPTVWIVRINLLEYSREFSNWKKYETAIDSLETLNFMCRVILGKENKVNIVLEEANGAVYLKDCTGDQWTVFELKLFLHFYNRRRLVFLFDGFDEICPHYTNEVIECLKTVSKYPQKHKMWITSRSYYEVKSILQREFGTSYEIKKFSREDTDKYLEKFWKYNLIIKEFDSKQLENVHDFLKFLSETESRLLQDFVFQLNYVYVNASRFLINEINNTCIPLWAYNKNIDVTSYHNQERYIRLLYTSDHHGTPLHLYLTADYFENKLKDVDEKTNKWNIHDTFTVYERFLETILKKIRYQEKNKMDINNPDIMMSFYREYADSMKKHKKLAAYAIFHQHSHTLFNTEELKEIKDMITLIEKEGDKTGLIHSVLNDIPIFVHMTFSEYLAVEYVCDIVKSENCIETQKSWMGFLFNVMMFIFNITHVREIFDYKMQMDKALVSVLQDNKEVIFGWLLEQGKVYSEYILQRHYHISLFNKGNLPDGAGKDIGSTSDSEEKNNGEIVSGWSLSVAVSSKLHNFLFLFTSICESCLNEGNLDEFLEIVGMTHLLIQARDFECDVLIIFVLDIVRKIDRSKLSSVVLDNFSYVPLTANYDTMTSEEIVALIHEDYDNKLPNPFEDIFGVKYNRLYFTRIFLEKLDKHLFVYNAYKNVMSTQLLVIKKGNVSSCNESDGQ